jgi:hypothetical protein
MKLLFDENLAPRVAERLLDLFPGSMRVRDVGLASDDDLIVWEHAKRHADCFQGCRLPTAELPSWRAAEGGVAQGRQPIDYAA